MAKIKHNEEPLSNEELQEIEQLAEGQEYKPLSEQEKKELIEMVEQSIKEAEQQEETIKDIEEIKQEKDLIQDMEENEMQVSNNQLQKSILEIHETLIINERESLRIDNDIYKRIGNLNDNICKVDTKLNKKYVIFLIIVSGLFFYGLGFTSHAYKEELKPLVSNLFGTAVEQTVRHGINVGG